MSDPVIVLAEFAATPEAFDAFLVLCAFDSTASVRDEPGCSRFDVLTDPEEPGTVVLHEIYADRAAYEAHRQTPHYATFAEGVQRLGVTLRRVRLLSHRHP